MSLSCLIPKKKNNAWELEEIASIPCKGSEARLASRPPAFLDKGAGSLLGQYTRRHTYTNAIRTIKEKMEIIIMMNTRVLVSLWCFPVGLPLVSETK